jgi:chaperonin GroES
MEETFKPLGDRVLIKPESIGEQKSKGGLILNDSFGRNQKMKGEVVAVGTGIFSQSGDKIPMTVKVGDTIMYEKSIEGSPFEIDGEKYLLFHEHQLLGILKK